MGSLDRRGAVFILTLGDDENRFHPDRLTIINAALDEVESADAPKAVVTTGVGKFYSNGLDLDFMSSNPDVAQSNLRDVHALFARVLAFPAPIVAGIQGHAFAAGAMLALAHDLCVMRGDRGYFCLPEVDLGIPFTAGMNALIRSRLPIATAHEAMTTARRYGVPTPRRRALSRRRPTKVRCSTWPWPLPQNARRRPAPCSVPSRRGCTPKSSPS